MQIKPLLKFLIPGVIVVAGVMYFLLRPPETAVRRPDANTVELSYNLCLRFPSPPDVRQTDSTLRQGYLLRFVIDSTIQYYAKSIIAPSGDTLHVSVFNRTSLNRAEQLVADSGPAILEKSTGRHDGLEYFKAFARHEDEYMIRFLAPDNRFQVVALIDQISRDSAHLYQLYQSDSLTQKLVKCI
jgi:hypothetical protein